MAQVALYKFVRLAGDLLMPNLFVPYVTMLTGLADSPAAAPYCFNLLKLNGNGSSNVSLDHFFQSLQQYHHNLKQEQPGLAQCETQNPAASGVHERLIQVTIQYNTTTTIQ